MTHPDLLTDEDLATRHKQKRFTNRYLCLVEGGIMCVKCGQGYRKGQVFLSCCPPSFDTFETAQADAIATIELNYKKRGYEPVDYMGTFEL